MKRLLSLLLLFVGFGAFAQTYDSLPTGSKPYGNFYLGPDGDLVFGNVGLKYRIVGTKKRVDSLLALKAPVSGSANYIQADPATPQNANIFINRALTFPDFNGVYDGEYRNTFNGYNWVVRTTPGIVGGIRINGEAEYTAPYAHIFKISPSGTPSNVLTLWGGTQSGISFSRLAGSTNRMLAVNETGDLYTRDDNFLTTNSTLPNQFRQTITRETEIQGPNFFITNTPETNASESNYLVVQEGSAGQVRRLNPNVFAPAASGGAGYVTVAGNETVTGNKVFNAFSGTINGNLNIGGGTIRQNVDTGYWGKLAYWDGSGYLGNTTINDILGYNLTNALDNKLPYTGSASDLNLGVHDLFVNHISTGVTGVSMANNVEINSGTSRLERLTLNLTPSTDTAPTKIITRDEITGELKQASTDMFAPASGSGSYVEKTGSTMTGDLILSSAVPTNALSAAPKSYIDNLITGLSWKSAVRVATTANITLSGTQTVDGISLVIGNRVLVKNQTDQTQNGIYIVGSPWTRPTDADNPDEITNATVAVTTGTLNKNTQWTVTAAVNTIGTENIVFGQISGAGTYAAGTNLNLSGNVFSVVPSPDFTTLGVSDNSTKAATTAFAKSVIASGQTIGANTSGNAATADRLSTARNINGIAFDGSSNIALNLQSITAAGATTTDAISTGAITSTGAISTSGTVFSQGSGVSTYMTWGPAFGAIGTQSAHPLVLRTNGIEAARILTNGNFGIGVTPFEKFHVLGNALITNSVGNKLKLQTTATGQSNYIQFLDAASTQTGYVGHGSSANTDMNLVSNTGNILLYANGATRLTLTNALATFTVPVSGTTANFSGKATVTGAPTNPTDVVRKQELDLKADANNVTLLADTVSAAPTPTSPGTKGQVIITGGYRYECIATNAWVRVAVQTTW